MDEEFSKPAMSYTDFETIKIIIGGTKNLPTINGEYGGEIYIARINNTIYFAQSVINTYLTPELAIKTETVKSIATNLAIWQMGDLVTNTEAQEKRYKESIRLLETIAKNSQKGLDGKGLQKSGIVEPAADLPFKKDFLL